jgi:hypothetical protein
MPLVVTLSLSLDDTFGRNGSYGHLGHLQFRPCCHADFNQKLGRDKLILSFISLLSFFCVSALLVYKGCYSCCQVDEHKQKGDT